VREDARQRVMQELRGAFRPEFLNRVDDVVLFKPLTLAEIEQIVDLQIAELQARLDDRDLQLVLTKEARAFVARAAYDPVYGARPLKRYLQHQLETQIGRALISAEAAPGSTVLVSCRDQALHVEFLPPGTKPPVDL
ncbi:MAG: type VI secretion system ATPase TssH, partial [Deltaproteobacteria bacterium]|nr:type VI secretion system ATPase TssH [Deltaproteobacteria bacterium]